MKRVKYTGHEPYDTDLKLAPIDVGFDLRSQGVAVTLPPQIKSVSLEVNGNVWIVEGTRTELIGAIERAGYTIAEPQNNRSTP